MKHFFLLLCLLLSITVVKSQNISFPDPDFKTRIITQTSTGFAKDLNGNWTIVDANDDNEIQVSEALNISWLNLDQSSISSLVGLQHFVNLKTFYCAQNQLTSLNMNGFPLLENLRCHQNYLTTLIVDQCPLRSLFCDYNELTAIDLSPFPDLIYFECANNQISELDLSVVPLLQTLDCQDNLITQLDLSGNPLLTWIAYANPNLTYLNIKNGVVGNLQNPNSFGVYGSPSLQYICCDTTEESALLASLASYAITDVVVNDYCSFEPGGPHYTVSGTTRLDFEGDGCGTSDTPIGRMKYHVEGQNFSFDFIAGGEDYTMPFMSGSYTITPVLEVQEAYTASPASITVNFPGTSSPLTQNFCITGITPVTETQIHLLPMNPARPGFNSNYKLIYQNTGNIMVSGDITFTIFEDDRVDFISSVPTAIVNGNVLTFHYNDLLPFESREISIVLNLNSPMESPAVNGGDQLNFSAHIIPEPTDVIPWNNGSDIKQIVVNSFDPNDKTCTAGPSIEEAMVGQYLDYVIRFENTGTFPAENIVVKDMIDVSKFDIASLVPISGSHDFFTRINGNKVEFIFENIMLPFDDATNDGYVAFKIKTLPTLAIGDTFSNSASIYFDYNFPIVTDPAVTTIENLRNKDFEFGKYFTIYPNPANDLLNIKSNAGIAIASLEIYNVLGQIVIAIPNAETTSAIDVSQLKSGTYFLKINSDKGATNAKFVRN